MAVEDVHPRAQREFYFRVSNEKGQVVGARTPEEEFWILTTTERRAWIDSSNRRGQDLGHYVDQLIDPWPLYWEMITLLLTTVAWLAMTGIDKYTGKHPCTAFEQSGLINTTKLFVEDFTGACWDWWPLLPSRQPLETSEFLIEWYCVSYLRMSWDRTKAEVT